MSSRPGPLPGVDRLLDYVPDGGRLLDVGCGGGQLAWALDRIGRRVQYVGVDVSERMIQLARDKAGELLHVNAVFLVRDVSSPGWADDLPGRPFHIIAALALLHHIPGSELRTRLLGDMARCLAPNGYVLVSTWQFLNSPRLRRRLRPWSDVGLSPDDVGADDYLLDWRRDGYGLRYCAWIDEPALRRLAADAGLQVIESFHAGRDNMNLCAVLSR
ncbi:MAG: class I SAM-dependent methyltransferase [Anaerolineae bacterium]|nr:class I SAM-dependent methyltransferase [Anaerolineae bacterium]